MKVNAMIGMTKLSNDRNQEKGNKLRTYRKYEQDLCTRK